MAWSKFDDSGMTKQLELGRLQKPTTLLIDSRTILSLFAIS